VAFVVCVLGTVTMYQMETHLVRQVVVSTIAAGGVCGMHYTGTSHTPPLSWLEEADGNRHRCRYVSK
jgi:NO-binding membrane sensor protein with MHYT domain